MQIARTDFEQGTTAFAAAIVIGDTAPMNVAVREGDPIFGTGLTATQLRVGFVAGNSSGQTAILMDTIDASGTTTTGFWRVTANGSFPLLRVGDPSPDGNGEVVAFHEGWASINERGDVAFVAGLTPTGLSTDPDGAVISIVGGVATVIAREGQLAPGGGPFGDFDFTAGACRPVIDDGSRVTFRASDGTVGTILQWDPVTGIHELLRTGQGSPDGQGLLKGFLNPVVSAAGTVGVLAVLDWQSSLGVEAGILVGDVTTGFEVAVRTGQPFPGGGATIGSSISMPHVNGSGTAAWVASDAPGTGWGLFMKQRGRPTLEITRSGTLLDGKLLELPEVPPIPNPGNGMSLNESDELVFTAWFQDGTQGIYLARPCSVGPGLPCVPLDAAQHSISASSGGADLLQLDAGPSRAGRAYLLLGSASGTWPGQSIGQAELPLNPDAWFFLTVANPNSALLPASFGLLDVQGQKSATLQLPPLPFPSLVGTVIHHAFVVANAAGTGVELASNATPVTLLP